MKTAWHWAPLFLWLIWHSLPAARAGEMVTVDLRGGRSTTAEIDARTNDQLLWLRTSAESMIFRRSIAWSDVLVRPMASNSLRPPSCGRRRKYGRPT